MSNSQQDKKTEEKTKDLGLSGNLITVSDPNDMASEAFRRMRANLLYAQFDAPPKVVMITSPGSAEGKSTICANLGVVLAQANKNTLILDCDLRRPKMHEMFGLSIEGGLVDVLMGELGLRQACQEPLPGLSLSVLTVGAIPPNPAELLDSRRFSEFLETVEAEFDYVLIDSSPTGTVSDPLILATRVDGVLLALDARKTRKGDVRRTMRGLSTVGAQVLGTVMNNVPSNKSDYGQGGPYYGQLG